MDKYENLRTTLEGRLFILEELKEDQKKLAVPNYGLNGQIKELKAILLIMDD